MDGAMTTPREDARHCVACDWTGDVGARAHIKFIHGDDPTLTVVEQMGQEFVVRTTPREDATPCPACGKTPDHDWWPVGDDSYACDGKWARRCHLPGCTCRYAALGADAETRTPMQGVITALRGALDSLRTVRNPQSNGLDYNTGWNDAIDAVIPRLVNDNSHIEPNGKLREYAALGAEAETPDPLAPTGLPLPSGPGDFEVSMVLNLGSETPDPTEYGQCGSLAWTVEKWGRVTHKHGCPNRTDPWCQSHPARCGHWVDLASPEIAEALARAAETVGLRMDVSWWVEVLAAMRETGR